MRVLSLFYHPPLKAGGAERRFLEVARRWETDGGLQHTVLEPAPTLYERSHRIAVPHTDPSLLNDLLQGGLFGMISLWRWTRGDHHLVLAPNNIITHVIPAFLIARLRRIPWVVVVHHFEVLGLGGVEETLAGIYRSWRRQGRLRALARALAIRTALWLVRKADGVIAVSDVFARLFDRAVVSGNGLDLARFDGAPVPRREQQACFVGRLSADKGVLDLLEVWRRLDEGPGEAAPLLLMGQDQMGVDREIARRGLEGRVTYLGEVPEDEKVRRLQASTLFVSASRSEGWGLGIGEALAAGLRVVCYDLPTLRAVWGHCSYVDRVPVGDVEAFARRVEEGLGQAPPPPDGTRTCVEDFRWDAVAARDLRFLRDIAGPSEAAHRHPPPKG